MQLTFQTLSILLLMTSKTDSAKCYRKITEIIVNVVLPNPLNDPPPKTALPSNLTSMNLTPPLTTLPYSNQSLTSKQSPSVVIANSTTASSTNQTVIFLVKAPAFAYIPFFDGLSNQILQSTLCDKTGEVMPVGFPDSFNIDNDVIIGFNINIAQAGDTTLQLYNDPCTKLGQISTPNNPRGAILHQSQFASKINNFDTYGIVATNVYLFECTFSGCIWNSNPFNIDLTFKVPYTAGATPPNNNQALVFYNNVGATYLSNYKGDRCVAFNFNGDLVFIQLFQLGNTAWDQTPCLKFSAKVVQVAF